ncbi:50S ribosomal protein L4 [bacterium]|nr:50S ribosomal protein L4 [bacterium]
MKVKVLNTSGAETGKEVNLPKEIFGLEPNDHAIYLDVKQYLANQRQGTHRTKEKGEIIGSTKKLKRQKGTGTARAGSIKSGLFKGGGRFHGPKPRDYGFKLNKKLKTLARKSALSHKANDKAIYVVDSVSFDGPKTKAYLDMLTSLKLNDGRTLMVIPDYDNNVYLSARNLPKAEVLAARDLNTYQILKAKNLILVEGSIDKIKETLN